MAQSKSSKIVQRSGHSLWELLLVMSLSSFISVTGLHLLHKILHSRQLNLDRRIEYAQYQSMMESLQDAVDRRYLNPFSNDAWLVIESGEGEGWFPLRRLQILTLNNGAIIKWEWEAVDTRQVYINSGSKTFLSAERPSSLKLRFPESRIRQFRDGIAIGIF